MVPTFTLHPDDPNTKKDLEYFGWDWIIVLHCVNHNLELGVLDLRKADEYWTIFDDTTKKTFGMYHWSSKFTVEAEAIAESLAKDFKKFGFIKDQRWSSSSKRAVEKLDANYTITCMHLESIASTKGHTRAAECRGILDVLTSVKFLKMLMLLQDFHGELEKISLFFQRVQLLLIEVKPKLKKTYAALKKLKQGKGSNMARFAKECDGVTYKDIILNTA